MSSEYSLFQMDIDSSALERLESAILGANGKHSFETQLKISIGSILKRTRQAMRTEAWRGVKDEYNITQKNFYRYTRVRNVKQAGGAAAINSGDMVMELEFAGGKIPIRKFGKERAIRPNTPVYASILRGSGKKLIKNAFEANMPDHGEGVFERTTNKRTPTTRIYGPSGPQMIDNEQVLDRIADVAVETFDKRIAVEINRILNGWNI